jgi:hypothetical protein
LSVTEGLWVKLIPSHPDAWGRGLLALLAGYFCSLCALEWSLLWDFAPYSFRPLVAGLLTVAFWTVLVLHQLPRDLRATTAMPALAWMAVIAWPVRLQPTTATLVFSSLVLALLMSVLNPQRAGVALLLALVLGLTMLTGMLAWPLAALSCLLAAYEIRRGTVAPWQDREPGLPARPTVSPDSRTAEISWKGLVALFHAAAPGEGERYTTTVLADTASIIEGCGGWRIRGSDLNGVYRFPNESSRQSCLDRLERYRHGVRQTLLQAQAPPLELVVSLPNEPGDPASKE